MAKTRFYGLGEYTFPRGWFMVADAGELRDVPLARRFFGRDLVLYRGRDSGRPVLLDAHCPHMGTHLAMRGGETATAAAARIEGDTLRCPRHRWRFAANGRCDHIPSPFGSESACQVPAEATIRSWPVAEIMGAVFAWHDPEDAAPDWQIPTLNEWHDPAWVRWVFDDLGILDCHPVEVIDNIVDAAHQSPVHGQRVLYFENEFSAQRVVQREGGVSRTALSEGEQLLSIDATYHGPGVLVTALGGKLPSYFMIAHTPVDDGFIQVWHAVLVKSPHPVASSDDIVAARAFQELSRLAFAQDFDIWLHKRPAVNILQIPADGPYHKIRQWCRQFYNPRRRTAEVTQGLDGAYSIRGLPTSVD